MKTYKKAFPLIFLLFCCSVTGQTISIKGSGPGYQNSGLGFYVQTDPITKRLKPVLNVSCDDKGSFHCEIAFSKPGLLFIKTGIYNLRLYITDSSHYEVLLPEYIPRPVSEERNPFFIETEQIPEVINNIKDVNNLIKAFDSDFNPVFNFVAESVFLNYRKDEIQKNIGKLDKYSNRDDQPFYSDYIRCRMMMLELVRSSSGRDQAKGSAFINNDFNSGNPAFSELAEQMFSGYFSKISSGPLADAFNRAVDSASYPELKAVVLKDGVITNSELADFVLLLNLNTDYYEHNLPGENIRKIISTMRGGETGFIRNIASEVLSKINSVLPGNLPPGFTLMDNDGRSVTMKDFRGKYLLLGFARADNPASLMEMGIINMWQKNYSGDLQVAIIITDKDFKAASAILKSHGFNWIFLNGSEKRESLEFTYDLKMYPSFLLLDREGKIIANPCPYPSEGLELTVKKIHFADPSGSGTKNR